MAEDVKAVAVVRSELALAAKVLRDVGGQSALAVTVEAGVQAIDALRAEVERLNRILGRIVEGDGDSTLTIRAGTDAFAAAREYLRPNT